MTMTRLYLPADPAARIEAGLTPANPVRTEIDLADVAPERRRLLARAPRVSAQYDPALQEIDLASTQSRRYLFDTPDETFQAYCLRDPEFAELYYGYQAPLTPVVATTETEVHAFLDRLVRREQTRAALQAAEQHLKPVYDAEHAAALGRIKAHQAELVAELPDLPAPALSESGDGSLTVAPAVDRKDLDASYWPSLTLSGCSVPGVLWTHDETTARRVCGRALDVATEEPAVHDSVARQTWRRAVMARYGEALKAAAARTRELKRDAKAENARRLRQLVEAHGQGSQLARFDEGVLPEDELRQLVARATWAPLNRLPRYRKIETSEIPCTCAPGDADPQFDKHAARRTRTAKEDRALKAVRETLAHAGMIAEVNVMRHQGHCRSCGAESPSRASIEVHLSAHGFDLARNFGVDVPETGSTKR